MTRIRLTTTFSIVASLSIPLFFLFSIAHASVENEPHSSLEAMLGIPGKSIDTDWLGSDVGVVGGYVRIGGALGGTMASTEENGSGKLDTCEEELWFQGDWGSGSAEMDFGVEWWAKYKIIVFGKEYIGDLPWIGSADLRWSDEETFTPYLLGQSVTLSDCFEDEEVISYPFGIPGVASVNIGVSLSACADNEIEGVKLATNRGTFFQDGEKKDVSVSGSFSVSSIIKTNQSTLDLWLRPNGTIGITVGPFGYTIHIPTLKIPIEIGKREFSSSPPRSVIFPLPCDYSISPASQHSDYFGGTGNVSVTAPCWCSWTATSNDSWITITSGSSGSGNGTVGYSIASNASTNPRTGY
ncbi:MAG: BACON domain-containing protein, partial [Thermodesulfobacteriota bacterium]|nr:BACON domain-containing protein [Thermodesulfobacteriota bacterium]